MPFRPTGTIFSPRPGRWAAIFALGLATIGAGNASAAAPRVVLVSGEYEYSSMLTLPALRDRLTQEYGFDCTYLQRAAGEHIPGLEAIDHADLVIGIIRRMTLPPEELGHFQRYLDSGRPLVGMRTMCHAFENWKAFDHDVLGGNYHGHYRLGPIVHMQIYAPAKDQPILAGVPDSFLGVGELYKTLPLAADANLLLQGSGPKLDAGPEAVAWTHRYHGARIFFTTMGHPADFNNAGFLQLLTNGIFWSLDRPGLKASAPIAPINGFPVREVNLEELAQLSAVTAFHILDLRPASDFAAGHVKKALNLDPRAGDFSQRMGAFDPNGFYLLYDGGGNDAAPAAASLHDRGCQFVYEFSGGFQAWRAAGKPTVN